MKVGIAILPLDNYQLFGNPPSINTSFINVGNNSHLKELVVLNNKNNIVIVIILLLSCSSI